ncbi:Fe-S oxidoreductase [candidate division KSB1 bacterium]|nr:MAG: Fe-S oxidoreductase [candidate division KSB1 bacterium]
MPQTVALFIPCLVDQLYPEIGMHMANVLRRAGVQVEYDQRQTCCGQPAFNTGYRDEARRVAEHFLDIFAGKEAIVAPSGSCVAMVRNFYPTLFANHARQAEATALGQHVFEFSEFLVKRLGVTALGARFPHKVFFHNSCHSYRELRLLNEPIALLRNVQDLQLLETTEEPVCCGFGGLFSFKFAPIASSMAASRLQRYEALGAEAIVTNDPGCLMQMRREAQSQRSGLQILHLAEVLDRT